MSRLGKQGSELWLWQLGRNEVNSKVNMVGTAEEDKCCRLQQKKTDLLWTHQGFSEKKLDTPGGISFDPSCHECRLYEKRLLYLMGWEGINLKVKVSTIITKLQSQNG